MNDLLNQPDFITELDGLDALERCTSNPLVRCYSNLSCASQEGGATFVPFGRYYNNDYVDMTLLQLHASEKKNENQDLSSMTISDLIGMNLSLKDLLTNDLICRFFKHQNGSRYVQNKLCNNAPSQIIDDVLKHIIFKKRELLNLSLDIYGNYVIQMFFEICNRKQRKLLIDNVLRGNMYRLTHSFYGCRVVQKAFDFISTEECVALIKELDNKLIGQCAVGQNANHVLQKILSLNCMVSDIYFYSRHMFACRIVQSVIANYGASIIDLIVNDHALILSLSVSEYGNYVIQDILCLNDDSYKSVVRRNVFENVLSLSKNKFGSNVVEKCLISSKDKERDLLLKQIIKNKAILKQMIQHKYANYVIQSLFINSNHKQQSQLIYFVEKNIPNLKSLTYGKHFADKIRKIKANYKKY